MLSILAFGMVVAFMTLIMTKRVSALMALILVPLLFALLATPLTGIDPAGLGKMMMAGVRELAPTGVML
ncbi:citrate transporter, partial [Escherichia coli]|nr:citrate transporter [Escherichia coli]